jgi:hypothetical protein
MGRFRSQVAEAAEGAIQPDYLVLASTHTHSGPESIALSDLYHREDFRKWASLLAERIGSAVHKGAAAMRPSQLLVGRRPAPGLAVNRRIETTRGITSVRRQLPPGVLIGPEGPVDDEARVLAFVEKKVTATSCAKHASGRSGKRCLSPFSLPDLAPNRIHVLRALIVARRIRAVQAFGRGVQLETRQSPG